MSSGSGRKEDAQRLWGGRFTGEPSADMDLLNRSLPVDRRLWREDIVGSQAWAEALAGAGVLEQAEATELQAGLDRVGDRLAGWGAADWAQAPDEDIHSLVERLLREEVGPLAGKLHTGRSRNDQVATDSRLWAIAAAARDAGTFRRAIMDAPPVGAAANDCLRPLASR